MIPKSGEPVFGQIMLKQAAIFDSPSRDFVPERAGFAPFQPYILYARFEWHAFKLLPGLNMMEAVL
jgi:hypothetical protein